MPDMGLGMEVAVPDIMSRPPHDLKTGVFTTELIVDMVVYGIWMSILCLASFVLVVFGFGDGNLGKFCLWSRLASTAPCCNGTATNETQ